MQYYAFLQALSAVITSVVFNLNYLITTFSQSGHTLVHLTYSHYVYILMFIYHLKAHILLFKMN